MDISSFFFGTDGRLRSGFRFLIFLALFTILATILVALSSRLFQSVTSPSFHFAATDLTILFAALLIGWLCNKYLDKLPYRSLGASLTEGWFKHFGLGLFTGTLTLCIGVLIAVLFGGLSFGPDPVDWNSVVDTLASSFLVFVVAAAAEEALSRGYPMQTFFHSDLKVFGIVFTALLFASGHLGNPNSTGLAFVNTLLGGVWFGVGYWKTRDLWFPFGMHLMWNWMQGAFFGIEVSGLTDITSAPLFKEIDRGPDWLTGGTYGIEGGVVCTVALILSTAIIYFYPTTSSKSEDPERTD